MKTSDLPDYACRHCNDTGTITGYERGCAVSEECQCRASRKPPTHRRTLDLLEELNREVGEILSKLNKVTNGVQAIEGGEGC